MPPGYYCGALSLGIMICSVFVAPQVSCQYAGFLMGMSVSEDWFIQAVITSSLALVWRGIAEDFRPGGWPWFANQVHQLAIRLV